jgi:hypothetical protein
MYGFEEIWYDLFRFRHYLLYGWKHDFFLLLFKQNFINLTYPAIVRNLYFLSVVGLEYVNNVFALNLKPH